MAVRPNGPDGITTHAVNPYQFNGPGRQWFFRVFVHVSKDIRFAMAPGARTGAPESVQRNIRLAAVLPFHGQLLANGLDIQRSHAHYNLAASAALLWASTSACSERPWESIVTTAGKSSTANSQMASGAPNFSIR